jgi:ABC-type glycerol-3-phosphate transport system permease component
MANLSDKRRRSRGLHRYSTGDFFFDLFVAIFMIVVAVCSFYPFLYILFYSLSNVAMINTPLLFWPKGFTVEAYKLLLSDSTVPHAFLISVLRTLITPVCNLLVCLLAAFALSHQHFPGRGFFQKFITIAMYFSAGMIPSYILMVRLHLTNSFLVYVIPGLFSVFNMIMIKTYIESIPPALEESAMIDGAGYFKVLFRVILPLLKPVLAALFLFMCVGQWNTYADTLLYNAGNKNLHTLSYVLMNFIQQSTSTAEQARERVGLNTVNTTSLKMSMTVLVVIPIMCVYPTLQKYFASGLMIGSIKG